MSLHQKEAEATCMDDELSRAPDYWSNAFPLGIYLPPAFPSTIGTGWPTRKCRKVVSFLTLQKCLKFSHAAYELVTSLFLRCKTFGQIQTYNLQSAFMSRIDVILSSTPLTHFSPFQF